MLVDNPIFQQSYFASGSSSSFQDYPAELNDIFDTELFNNSFASFGSNSTQSSPPSGSRDSSPNNILTPPQDALPTSFPDVHDNDTSPSAFLSLYDDEMKAMDTMSAMPSTDFLSLSGMGFDGAYGGGAVGGGYDLNMSTFNMGMPMDMSALGVVSMPMEDPTQASTIDPQLVDTPSAISDHGDDESDEKESPQSPVDVAEKKEAEKPQSPTITIAPVKVGGHGKARRGTVQSGGVTKKTVSSAASKEKENPTSSLSAATKKALAAKTSATATATTSTTPGPFLTAANSAKSSKAESEAGDPEDDDDLPHDWRPSPEVFAKMTSKEKRQLRNKISARNFRVRRKEYISTLEGDIAERDRMLDHYRTQLGSTESENLALRQEIAALKKALLDGRNGTINLPPPAPLPEQSAAEALAAAASTSTSTTTSTSAPLLTPNTQKDLPSSSSPRMSNRFWGGLGVGGGYTPVHTTLVPDVSTAVRRGLQENMNPALNGPLTGSGLGVNKGLSGFDGFSDLNPFTMKTLDAYRMHLWGKMAAQQHQQHHHNNSSPTPPSPPTNASGLASNMRPHFFTPSSKANIPAPANSGSTLSALLSGKQAAASYPSPPTSPQLNPKLFSAASPKERELQQQRDREQQQAMLAAMASQTVFRKLGSAFWDAFTGSSSSSSSSSSASSVPSGTGNWDADKVQKILSGKAVLKVVDVEPASPPATPKPMRASTMPVPSSSSSSSSSLVQQDDCKKCLTDILEESMRSLTIGKKM